MSAAVVEPRFSLVEEAPALEPVLTLDHVSKRFGSRRRQVTALEGVSLEVGRGEFLCILGASGCGKSTLLSLIAGLDRVSEGTITTPVERPALMFQEAALLPWLTVRRNVELPLRLRGLGASQRGVSVNHLLGMIGLVDFADSRPHELSGGMRQRVSLARALAQESPLLLMDEPFGALDAITRDTLHADLERIWRETGASILFVTHNVREAVRLGDRVVLMSPRPGRIEAEWRVDIPRPREIDSVAVAELASDITARLRRTVNGNQ